MSSEFGKNIKVSIFGQSHSKGIGAVIDGIPAGYTMDIDQVLQFMQRRAPGRNSHSTARKEADRPDILSGIVDGITCGAPICAVIENGDTRSKDYDEIRKVPRPGHADFTAYIKYGLAHDIRGGGHFSGRLTAPLCFAGAISMQVLQTYGIKIGAHIYSIGNVGDTPFDPLNPQLESSEKEFPVIDDKKGEKMKAQMEEARKNTDSLGGVIECAVTGFPAGVGNPMFDGVENRLAQVLFGVPAVRGVEFGSGFAQAAMTGSESNDPFYIQDGDVKTRTNNHGGVLGGISSGMPIIFRVAVKPTPSVAMEQDSVNLLQEENTKLTVHGRHDPCIVPRAVPCMEAAAAVVLLDMLMDFKGEQGFKL